MTGNAVYPGMCAGQGKLCAVLVGNIGLPVTCGSMTVPAIILCFGVQNYCGVGHFVVAFHTLFPWNLYGSAPMGNACSKEQQQDRFSNHRLVPMGDNAGRPWTHNDNLRPFRDVWNPSGSCCVRGR